MSRISKFLSLSVVVVFLLACNFITQPLNDAQNLAETAQSVTTFIPAETLQALPSVLPTVISAETLQALPSAAPTLEALATEFGNAFDPQGTPVQEWNSIPIMPQATAGQEFGQNSMYSFRASVTVKEVQDFYNEKLGTLGWNQPFSIPNQADFGMMLFEKDNAALTITITAAENSSIVTLTLTNP